MLIDRASVVLGVFDPPAGDRILPAYMFFANCFINSATLIRTDVLRALRYRPDFEPAEDYDLFNRIAMVHPVANLTEPVIRYRVHGANVSERKAGQKRAGERKVIAENLERLGVEATGEVISLHHLFISKNFAAEGVDLKKAGAYLLMLRQANERSGLFQPRVWNKVLMWQWTVALRYAGLRPSNLLIYATSGLSRLSLLDKRYFELLRRTRS